MFIFQRVFSGMCCKIFSTSCDWSFLSPTLSDLNFPAETWTFKFDKELLLVFQEYSRSEEPAGITSYVSVKHFKIFLNI